MLFKYKINYSQIEGNYNELNILENIQNKLNLKYGSWKDEHFEQLLSLKYINPNAKVLELGGNIGRVSMIISSILNDGSNHVVIETDKDIAKQLLDNRDSNKLKFKIETSAISEVKLVQNGWVTKELTDNLNIEEWKDVSIISFNNFKNKYNIDFDTLVIDCEACFYSILKDDNTILNNIKMIIIENDYQNIEQYEYVKKLLFQNNFRIVETIQSKPALFAGFSDYIADRFHEVYQK